MLWGCAVLALVSVIGANLLRDRDSADRQADSGAADTIQAGTPQDDPPLRLTRDAPPFSLIDQNEQPVTLETLKGKPFIANFIFTNCGGPCPLMSAKMATLQKSVPAGVNLVSFSVDPKQDRPAVLKEYAKRFKADNSRWHFLTVAKPEEADAIFAVAKGMLVPAEPAKESSPIIHSEKFVLVDAEGMIRSYYSSNNPKHLEELKADAAALLNEPTGKK